MNPCTPAWNGFRCIVVAGLVAVVAAACSSVPARTARNEPICPAGTRATRLLPGPAPVSIDDFRLPETHCAPGDDLAHPTPMPSQRAPRARTDFAPADVPEAFVGVSISGGGSRSAVFGLAVLKQLSALGILQHVSAISTTSGGGLPGAYYALNGPDLDWAAAESLMAEDYLGKWLKSHGRPSSLMRVLATDEDRTDLLADVFDEVLFHGSTFGDLGNFQPGTAPLWLANATEVGASRRFTFSEKSFAAINSDLASYPIAQAVASSAAFPGVFNSVTLRDYRTTYVAHDGTTVPGGVTFKHLIDGGPTDNLGIEALLELAGSHRRQSGDSPWAPEPGHHGRCLLVIVDSHPDGVPSRYATRSDLRGAAGRLVDLNVLDAIDALLATRRTDLLGYLGLDYGGIYQDRTAPQFVYFDTPIHNYRIGQTRRVGTDDIDPLLYSQLEPSQIAARVPVAPGSFRCAVWHVNLSGLEAIAHYDQRTAGGVPRLSVPSEEADEQRHFHRRLVSQIDTNFRLKGPEGCSAALLEEALKEAASVLVREDYRSRKAACEWLGANGLAVDEGCARPVSDLSMDRFPLRGRIVPSTLGPGGPVDETVRCLR